MQGMKRGRKRKVLSDTTESIASPVPSSSSSSSSSVFTNHQLPSGMSVTDNDTAIAAALGENDFVYYFGLGESNGDPDYTEKERNSTPNSNSAPSSSSSTSSSSILPLPPATPKSQARTAKTAAKSLIATTIESFDHTAFIASDNALDPANATKRLRAERLSQFGTGRMATTLSNDQKLAAKQEPDLNI
jgi:hypothetical protein